jgi:hypothetical protein
VNINNEKEGKLEITKPCNIDFIIARVGTANLKMNSATDIRN